MLFSQAAARDSLVVRHAAERSAVEIQRGSAERHSAPLRALLRTPRLRPPDRHQLSSTGSSRASRKVLRHLDLRMNPGREARLKPARGYGCFRSPQLKVGANRAPAEDRLIGAQPKSVTVAREAEGDRDSRDTPRRTLPSTKLRLAERTRRQRGQRLRQRRRADVAAPMWRSCDHPGGPTCRSTAKSLRAKSWGNGLFPDDFATQVPWAAAGQLCSLGRGRCRVWPGIRV